MKTTKLIIPFLDKNYTLKKIKKDYKLKHEFEIKTFYNKKIKFNFLTKLFFSFKILDYIRSNKNNSIIISRSIIPSLILSFLKIDNILEIHTEMTGFTRFFFYFTKLKWINQNLKFIFINDYLRKKFDISKKKSIILIDAVDYRDFKKSKKKIISNTCFYSGSFAKGKGLELILKISKELPNIKFHLYGNEDTVFDKSLLKIAPKNVHFKGYITYSELTKKINLYKVLLMPYQKQVGVLLRNINVANYFSPLKMFDYLAAGKIIIASDLPVYRNVLKHKKNSILLDNNHKNWCNLINQALSSNKFNHLGKSAFNHSKKYSWIIRVEKILKFNSH